MEMGEVMQRDDGERGGMECVRAREGVEIAEDARCGERGRMRMRMRTGERETRDMARARGHARYAARERECGWREEKKGRRHCADASEGRAESDGEGRATAGMALKGPIHRAATESGKPKKQVVLDIRESAATHSSINLPRAVA